MGRKRLTHDALPQHSDWVEWGDERILPVDFTEGGAPIGVSDDALNASREQASVRVNWADARDVLRELLHRAGAPNDAPVGRIRFLGDGLTAWAPVLANQSTAISRSSPQALPPRRRRCRNARHWTRGVLAIAYD